MFDTYLIVPVSPGAELAFGAARAVVESHPLFPRWAAEFPADMNSPGGVAVKFLECLEAAVSAAEDWVLSGGQPAVRLRTIVLPDGQRAWVAIDNEGLGDDDGWAWWIGFSAYLHECFPELLSTLGVRIYRSSTRYGDQPTVIG